MSAVEKIKQIFSCEARSHVGPWNTDSIRILKQIEKEVLKILERRETTNMVLIEQLDEVIREQEQKLQHFKKWVESLVVADQFSKSARLARLNEKFVELFGKMEKEEK